MNNRTESCWVARFWTKQRDECRFTKVEKTVGEVGLGRKMKSSVLDVLNLRCLVDICARIKHHKGRWRYIYMSGIQKGYLNEGVNLGGSVCK